MPTALVFGIGNGVKTIGKKIDNKLKRHHFELSDEFKQICASIELLPKEVRAEIFKYLLEVPRGRFAFPQEHRDFIEKLAAVLGSHKSHLGDEVEFIAKRMPERPHKILLDNNHNKEMEFGGSPNRIFGCPFDLYRVQYLVIPLRYANKPMVSDRGNLGSPGFAVYEKTWTALMKFSALTRGAPHIRKVRFDLYHDYSISNDPNHVQANLHEFLVGNYSTDIHAARHVLRSGLMRWVEPATATTELKDEGEIRATIDHTFVKMWNIMWSQMPRCTPPRETLEQIAIRGATLPAYAPLHNAISKNGAFPSHLDRAPRFFAGLADFDRETVMWYLKRLCRKEEWKNGDVGGSQRIHLRWLLGYV